mmetsp:Transcript_171743/g.545378  ORF Transcript_171743/g.545378 Transcript_171743/m.545378 type:complete len:243 (+) Transcript_171743:26-754(+)
MTGVVCHMGDTLDPSVPPEKSRRLNFSSNEHQRASARQTPKSSHPERRLAQATVEARTRRRLGHRHCANSSQKPWPIRAPQQTSSPERRARVCRGQPQHRCCPLLHQRARRRRWWKGQSWRPATWQAAKERPATVRRDAAQQPGRGWCGEARCRCMFRRRLTGCERAQMFVELVDLFPQILEALAAGLLGLEDGSGLTPGLRHSKAAAGLRGFAHFSRLLGEQLRGFPCEPLEVRLRRGGET